MVVSSSDSDGTPQSTPVTSQIPPSQVVPPASQESGSEDGSSDWSDLIHWEPPRCDFQITDDDTARRLIALLSVIRYSGYDAPCLAKVFKCVKIRCEGMGYRIEPEQLQRYFITALEANPSYEDVEMAYMFDWVVEDSTFARDWLEEHSTPHRIADMDGHTWVGTFYYDDDPELLTEQCDRLQRLIWNISYTGDDIFALDRFMAIMVDEQALRNRTPSDTSLRRDFLEIIRHNRIFHDLIRPTAQMTYFWTINCFLYRQLDIENGTTFSVEDSQNGTVA